MVQFANKVITEEHKVQRQGCICVSLGTKDKFGIPYNGVVEVGTMQLITPIPHMPDIVAGITNWRGKIVTVINTAKLLWNENESYIGNGKLIFVCNQNILIAMFVNEVIKSMEYDEKKLDPPLPVRGVIKPDYIAGINDNSISILNIDTIFKKIQSDILSWRSV